MDLMEFWNIFEKAANYVHVGFIWFFCFLVGASYVLGMLEFESFGCVSNIHKLRVQLYIAIYRKLNGSSRILYIWNLKWWFLYLHIIEMHQWGYDYVILTHCELLIIYLLFQTYWCKHTMIVKRAQRSIWINTPAALRVNWIRPESSSITEIFIESHWNWMQRYNFRLIYKVRIF